MCVMGKLNDEEAATKRLLIFNERRCYRPIHNLIRNVAKLVLAHSQFCRRDKSGKAG
jgi:hypothetical protein